jgi:hypothetical protein
MNESYLTREYLRRRLLQFELRLLGCLVLVILTNHFWK